MKKARRFMKPMVLFMFVVVMGIAPQIAAAHCDTLDGPVVIEAKVALEKGDITPLLKWVKKTNEAEIRDLFNKTLAVRGKGKDVQELADMYFFETLVRVHRAGEGAPYTGLKREPAEPIIAATDKALESGSIDHVVKHVTEAAAKGIRERFARTAEAKKHAGETVEKGREFVEAYVDFTHFVERLHMDIVAKTAHHSEGKKDAKEGAAGHKH